MSSKKSFSSLARTILLNHIHSFELKKNKLEPVVIPVAVLHQDVLVSYLIPYTGSYPIFTSDRVSMGSSSCF